MIICQCVLPCRLPFRDADGDWQGCALAAGHPDDLFGEGGHSLDGPGVIHYRPGTETAGMGPRLMPKPSEENRGELVAECWRCKAVYRVSVHAEALPMAQRAELATSQLTKSAGISDAASAAHTKLEA